MLVAFDSSFLIPLLDKRALDKGELDPRISYLVSVLDKDRTSIIVPAPAMSEALIGAGDAAPDYLRIINLSSRIRVAPFGDRAAVETAAAHREALRAGDKKEGLRSWAKVKYDRQIVSIAIVEGVDRIYSNDEDIKKLAAGSPLEVLNLDDLPLPPPPPVAPPPPPRRPSLFDDLQEDSD